MEQHAQRIPRSSVVLANQQIEMADALTSVGKDKAHTTNPLVRDGKKLIPSVTRVSGKKREMLVCFQAYHPKVEAVRPMLAFVSFYRDGTKIMETQPAPPLDAVPTRLKTLEFRFQVDLASLRAGPWIFQVTLLDPGGNRAAFWRSEIAVMQQGGRAKLP